MGKAIDEFDAFLAKNPKAARLCEAAFKEMLKEADDFEKRSTKKDFRLIKS